MPPDRRHPDERYPDERYPDERYPDERYRRAEPRPNDDRSLVDLLGELTTETRELVRQEINLAQTEISEKTSQATQEVKDKAAEAGKDAAYVGLGGAVAYAGLIALVFSLALLLGSFMPDWLGFLIVGVLVAGIGYALAQSGLKKLRQINYALETDFSLSKTKQTLQEDKQWMKEEAREIKENETETKPSDRQSIR